MVGFPGNGPNGYASAVRARMAPVEYTAAARARIALSAAAAELSDRLFGIVDTQHETTSQEVSDLVKQVDSLAGAVDELRRLAVVYARERSQSWEKLGQSLGVTRQTAHARFAGVVAEWRNSLYDPDRHSDEWLPDGAYNPEKVVPRLDAWLARHEPRDEQPYSVSVGLPTYTDDPTAYLRESLYREWWLCGSRTIGEDDLISDETPGR